MDTALIRTEVFFFNIKLQVEVNQKLKWASIQYTELNFTRLWIGVDVRRWKQ